MRELNTFKLAKCLKSTCTLLQCTGRKKQRPTNMCQNLVESFILTGNQHGVWDIVIIYFILSYMYVLIWFTGECLPQKPLRVERQKGKAALGKLRVIDDLPKERCCVDNCVMVSGIWSYTVHSSVLAWSLRSLLSKYLVICIGSAPWTAVVGFSWTTCSSQASVLDLFEVICDVSAPKMLGRL